MSRQLREGTLTVLFTDLEGSTDLRNRIGDEAANDLIQTHARLIRSKVAEYGGAEAKFLGDGFMILFDSAGQALKCAVEIQIAIAEHNRRDAGEPIKVRMGLNTGDISRQAEDVYGTAVNAAARICDKAQAGQIFISQTVKDLAGYLPDIRILDRGLSWLKGFPNRWRLFEVVWQKQSEAGTRPKQAPAPALRERAFSRSRTTMIGRTAELAVIRSELEAAHAGALRAVALEGEAGIGKTRLLEHTCEMADRMEPPFSVLRVAADEELRGPFFLFRTLFATPTIETFAERASALEDLERARASISGKGSHLPEGLSPQEEMLRVFDEASQAIRSLARERPVALLLDDLQWADIDSIRLIRYLVRTSEGIPLFIMLTLRPESDASGGASGNLVADLERMHISRRLQLRRFTRGETAELLHAVLGGPVAPAALDSLQARAEGVPFFVEEFGRAYREANVLQQADGSWTLARLSGPSVPISVQSLIARRLAQLPPESQELLANAAILGRSFRLKDLASIMETVRGAAEASEWKLADAIEPAIDLGIVAELPESSRYDYTFTHDQIQAALVESQGRQAKRRVHAAIADMMSRREDTDAGALSAMAYHALAAGDDKRGVSWAIQAARASLEARAPEESLRIIDAALKGAASREDRVALLRTRDDDLALLDRGTERLASLAELEALSSAVGDPSAEMEVKLRKASALRASGDFETAAEVASQVRQAAALNGLPGLELEACLEMGQALTRSPLGEAYWPLVEVDPDAAAEPFERGLTLARELGEKSLEAATLRELGVLENGRVKNRVMSDLQAGGKPKATFMKISQEGYFARAKDLLSQALHLYEEAGDARGATSSLIAMAYSHAPEWGRRGEAGRIEQIRRLQSGMKRLVTESRRIADDAQMLYSIHVFARTHVYPDLALYRGQEAFEASRSAGDKKLEFLSAGGVAITYLSLLQLVEARAWLDRARALAPFLGSAVHLRRLHTWTGLVNAADGKGAEAMEDLEAAVTASVERGSPAGRCETLAVLSLEAAKLGARTGSEWILERATTAADQARETARTLPGQLAWEAQAWAATALVSLVEGDRLKAAEATRTSLAVLEPRFKRELYMDVLWIAAKTLIAEKQPEGRDLAQEIRENLEVIDRSTIDRKISDLWFAAPMHAELAQIAEYERLPEGLEDDLVLEENEIELLGLLSSGMTDSEIATALEAAPETLEARLSGLFGKLGVANRTAAREYAVKVGVA